MKRRAFLAGTAGSLLLGSAACSNPSETVEPVAPPETTPEPPTNVVVIYLDDMRRDGLDFMPKTRELFDHEFTEARANGGACTDTRMGLFTGTYILHHPWDVWRTVTDRDPSKTWGPWMQDAGYRTGMFGKYIGTDGWPFGIEPGWDVWRSYVAEAHAEMGYEIDLGTLPLDPITPDVPNLVYMIDQLTEFSLAGGAPFFASWNPQHPHANYAGEFDSLPGYEDRFTDLPSPVPVDEDITGKPQWVQELAPISPEKEADIRRAQRGQAQVLAGVDDAIADFFAALETAGLLEHTVVMLSSDQGVHYGEHRWGAALDVPAGMQKGTLYEPVVHVPMLATGPGFPTGTTTVPVTQADITATVIGIAGATPSHDLDGIDLRSIVENPTPHRDRVVLLQSSVVFTPVPDHDSIVTGPDHSLYPHHKYGRLVTGEVEMYDLGTDPDELVNLAENPERIGDRDALAAMLAGMLAS